MVNTGLDSEGLSLLLPDISEISEATPTTLTTLGDFCLVQLRPQVSSNVCVQAVVVQESHGAIDEESIKLQSYCIERDVCSLRQTCMTPQRLNGRANAHFSLVRLRLRTGTSR